MSRFFVHTLPAVIALAVWPPSTQPVFAADAAFIGGQYFAAGENLEIARRGDDDIFAAGGEIRFENAAGDHLVAVGGRVVFRAVRARDIVSAAGSINLGGEVADDVLLAGGVVRITKGSVVGDAALLAGREVHVDGKVGGSMWAAAESVTVSGEVAGDVNIDADRIVIAPGARIGGDVSYVSRREAVIASDAAILGEVRYVRSDSRYGEWADRPGRWAPVLAAFLAMVALGAVLQAAMPRLLATAAATVATRPWGSLGIGFAVLIATPVAGVLMVATVVGMPLAVATLAAYFALLFPAVVVFAYWLGIGIGRLVGRPARERRWWPRLGWTAAGLAILAVIAMLPWVAGPALLIALVFGLGGLVIAMARHLNRPVDPLPPA